MMLGLRKTSLLVFIIAVTTMLLSSCVNNETEKGEIQLIEKRVNSIAVDKFNLAGICKKKIPIHTSDFGIFPHIVKIKSIDVVSNANNQKILDLSAHCKEINGDYSKGLHSGLDIEIPEGYTVRFDKLKIKNVYKGIWKKGNGTLDINELRIENFSEDAVFIQGSNVEIDRLITKGNEVNKRKWKVPYSWIYSKTGKKVGLNQLRTNLENQGMNISEADLKKLTWNRVINCNWLEEKDNKRLCNKKLNYHYVSSNIAHPDAIVQVGNIRKASTFIVLKANEEEGKNRLSSTILKAKKEDERKKKIDIQFGLPFKDYFTEVFYKFYEIEINEILEKSSSFSPKTIENIDIKTIQSISLSPYAQAIALTESVIYKNIKLAYGKVDGATSCIQTAYPFWINATNLNGSKIGSSDLKLSCSKDPRKDMSCKGPDITKYKENNKYFCSGNSKEEFCYAFHTDKCGCFHGTKTEMPLIYIKPKRSTTTSLSTNLNGVVPKGLIDEQKKLLLVPDKNVFTITPNANVISKSGCKI